MRRSVTGCLNSSRSGGERVTKKEYQIEGFWLWLCSLQTMYRMKRQQLLDYFQTPEEVFLAPEKEILAFPDLNIVQKQELLQSRSTWDLEKKQHQLRMQGIRFISSSMEAYPEKLRNIYDYPHGLFVKGRLPDPHIPTAAVVGARSSSAYGRHFATEIARELAACQIQVVSGMARGIDGIAQKSVLEAGGESFAVLGNGVDICYPQQHEKLYRELTEKGGVLSEFPLGTQPLPRHFPMRNRIISGLSDLVIVVEAREQSGSLITADQALEQGRDVMAVPGRTGDALSAGCNRLIAQGAEIFLSVEQLAERMKVKKKSRINRKKTNLALESEENLVYSVLEFQTKNLQSIADETGLTPHRASAVLVRLMLRGLVAEDVKNHYSKI